MNNLGMRRSVVLILRYCKLQMHIVHHVVVAFFLTTSLLAMQLHVPPGGSKCIRESLPAGSNVTFRAYAAVPLHLHVRDWGRRIIAHDMGTDASLNVTVPRYGVRRRRHVELEYTFCMRARNEARVHFDIRVRGEAILLLSKLVGGIDLRRNTETRIFTAADRTAELLVRASVLSGVVLVLNAIAQFALVRHAANTGLIRGKPFHL